MNVKDYVKIYDNFLFFHIIKFDCFSICDPFERGLARTQTPTTRNCAPEFPTFGEIAKVNPTEVQWKGLALGEPPSWSRLTPTPGKYAEIG